MPETIARILLFPFQLLVFLLLLLTAIIWVPLIALMLWQVHRDRTSLPDLEPEFGDYDEPVRHRAGRRYDLPTGNVSRGGAEMLPPSRPVVDQVFTSRTSG